MFEESMSIPGIWASMNSWFTPTVLFVLLNVMIGTIAVTSGLGAQKPQNHQQQQQEQGEKTSEDSHQQPHLNRSPSVLQRLKSINFYAYSYRSQEPISTSAPEIHTHELDHQTHEPEQPHEEKEHTHVPKQPHEEEEEEYKTHEQEQQLGEGEKTMEEVYYQLQGSHNRTKSDTVPASGEVPVKLPRKMRKSATVKSAFSHFAEDDIVVESRRPATVKEGKAKVIAEVDDGHDEDDVEVDAKADDFINRFKQQLKLQRLDSIVRYKEMVNRGGGGK